MPRLTAVMAVLMLLTIASAALANGTTAPVIAPQPVEVQPVPTQPAAVGAGPIQPIAQCPANAVAVDNNSAYIVTNNQLWKVNKFNGQLLGCTMLPESCEICPPSSGAQPSSRGAGPSAVGSQPSATGTGPRLDTTPSTEVPLPPTELEPEQPSDVPNPVTGMTPASAGMGPSVSYTQPAMGAGPSEPIMSGPTSVAVDSSTVYVARGNQLMRFRSDNLQYLGCSSLSGSQVMSQAGMVGAGPACVPGTAMGAAGQIQVSTSATCPPISMPAGPGSGPAGCPPSTITVCVSKDIQTEINNMRGLSSCELEQAYMRSLVRANAGAIVWSQLAQQKATQPQLQDFATNFINSACQQNQQLQQGMETWYGMQAPVVVTPSDAQTYARLQSLSGSDFDVAYMQAMLGHNAGVEQLSAHVQQRVCHSEAARSIKTIRNVQGRQSDQLRTWLRDWYNVTVL